MRPMARTQRFARRVLAAPAHSVTQTCVRKKQVRKSKVRKMCAKCAKGDGGKSVRGFAVRGFSPHRDRDARRPSLTDTRNELSLREETDAA